MSAREGGRARIVARRSLRYADGGDAAAGRPPHVRAASGLAWQEHEGARVLVAPQDDASFLAVLVPPDGPVSAIALDYAPGGARVFEARAGTKALKLDLECIAAIDGGRAWALGSGSHANRRRIVVLEGRTHRVVDAGALYDRLAAETRFAGAELNVEGATRRGDQLLLANRGNGAPREDVPAVDAIAALRLDAMEAFLAGRGPVPAIERVEPYDLGTVEGARLTFTDLATDAHGALWYLASAERSPNAYDDGEVVGAVVGAIDAEGRARHARIVDEQGAPSRGKPEGLALAGEIAPGRVRAYACLDADDPDTASELVTLEIELGV
ncbi:MAG: hypothetical protein U0234_11250 [Sandaracinus sp.]